MPTPPRIVTIFCSHYFPYPGGVERYVSLQAQEFVRLGFTVRIVTHDSEHVGWLEEQPGVAIYRLKCWSPLAHSRIPFPTSLRELGRLWRILRAPASELTVVHTRYYALSLIGCLMARGTGSRLALIDHSSDYIQLGAPWLNALCHIYEHVLTLMLRFFRPQFFGVAQASQQWLKRFGIRDARVCYNGIDTSTPLPPLIPLRDIIGAASDKKVILSVGRLVREKGFLELVNGFLQFAGNRDDYMLVIIGRGELDGELQALSRQHPQVLFLGPQSLTTVFSMMRQSFCLMNPSNYPEGLPTILLEAGLCGLAVISTPSGGAVELITNGKTGLLIERGAPGPIMVALQTLGQTPGLGEQLGRELKARVEADFSCAHIAERFLFDDMGLPR